MFLAKCIVNTVQMETLLLPNIVKCLITVLSNVTGKTLEEEWKLYVSS